VRRILIAVATAAVLGPSAVAGAAAPAPPTPTFRNAVSDSFADTFADPSVIQAKDGWWYAYSTADPLRAGDPPGVMHIARTRDFVTWDYRGTVFDSTNRPAWATPTAGLWAPDIRYVDGRYVMYFTVTDTTLHPSGSDYAIGVATSPTPEGPWQPTAAPIVPPRGPNFEWTTIDPAGFTDVDGQNYLYFGSYYGGLFGTKVSRDGLTPVGEPVRVAIDNRYEGSYVQRRDGWYYLTASSANCCAGPSTGYAVFAGRSRSPLGPFVDADGIPLTKSAVGGTNVVTQNGNRWIGTGHHAVATDTTGKDFLVYHALDRNQPWLTTPFGINRRPMLLDRLDWIDGWPRTRAGAGPSDSPQPAPVTASLLGVTPWDPATAGLKGAVRPVADAQGGQSALVSGTAVTAPAPAGTLRVRVDLKGAPTTLLLGHDANPVVVRADPSGGTLRITSGSGANAVGSSDDIRPTTGWQTLVVTVDGTSAQAFIAESDLGDPSAAVSVARTAPLAQAPVRIRSADGLVDNLSVQRPAVEDAAAVPVPRPGATLARDDFESGVAPEWSWVRPQEGVTVDGGTLDWPLRSVDLVGTANTGALLLREAPSGDWVAETELTLDLGADTVRNYQQAGMIVHRTDDDFARLGTVAIWNTRQTEYGREVAAAPDGRTTWGGSLIGTPAPHLWMRIAHNENAAGEHLYRAATSRDGQAWDWGAVWTFAAGAQPRIGLYAGGGASPATTARFESFTMSTTVWPATP
jgi:hypothetical protein